MRKIILLFIIILLLLEKYSTMTYQIPIMVWYEKKLTQAMLCTANPSCSFFIILKNVLSIGILKSIEFYFMEKFCRVYYGLLVVRLQRIDKKTKI